VLERALKVEREAGLKELTGGGAKFFGALSWDWGVDGKFCSL
jgi:hypothetical protein